MATRDIKKEQEALKDYGKIQGKMPKSSEEWHSLHQLAYGSDIPEELLKQTGHWQDLTAAISKTDVQFAPTNQTTTQTPKGALQGPRTSTPGTPQRPGTQTTQQTTQTTQGQTGLTPGNFLQAPQLQAAQQQIQQAGERLKQFQSPRTHLNVLQEAIKLKTDVYNKGIAESPIFKQAGLTGIENLGKSLSLTGQALRTDQATKYDIVNNMLGTYRDMAAAASSDYENAVNLYETQVKALQDTMEQINDYNREFELIDRKFQADAALYEFKKEQDAKYAPIEAPAERFGDIRSLRNDYLKQSGDYMTIRDSFSKLQSSFERSQDIANKDELGPIDVSMIFSYMKMLDPGSVVREGEQATARNAAGVGDQVRNLYNRLLVGATLTPNQREGFYNEAKSVYDSQQAQQNKLASEFRRVAAASGIDPDLVTIDIMGDVAQTVAREVGQDFSNKLEQARNAGISDDIIFDELLNISDQFALSVERALSIDPSIGRSDILDYIAENNL